MASRPRASILSLFDPLSSSPSDYDISQDKENHAGEVSFFHPEGSKSPVTRHTLRRRLVDIGDMTMDEPSIQDLLEDEEELEQLHAIEDDDDGNTLTWKDMAKAATPKWSKRHATSFTTPKASPSQRVPLGELSFKDDATPIARKKTYKRPMTTMMSKLSQPDPTPTCTIAILPPSPQKEQHSPISQSFSIFSQPAGISELSPNHLAPESPDPLGSSVSTLSLPTATGTLISDTSLPLSMSFGSSRSSHSSLSPILSTIDSPPSQARLRPIQDESYSNNRHSVDLGASFQLHLGTSDDTFDLLNEKISFLDAKDDSFLRTLEMDSSDEDDFKPPAPRDSENRQLRQLDEKKTSVGLSPEASQSVPKVDYRSVDSGREPKPTFTKRLTQAMKGTSPRDRVRTSSMDIDELSAPSTPTSSRSTFNPTMPPVAGLNIVKRAKTLTRRLSTATNLSSTSNTMTARSTSSNRTSRAPLEIPISAHSRLQPSLSYSPAAAERATRRIPPAALPGRVSDDGPRRVLISEGPKVNSATVLKTSGSLDPSKATLTTKGPRRVPANIPASNIIETPALPQANPGLKQPAKYATSGPTSAIPKPISRIPGSRLPAPSSVANSKSRIAASSGAGSMASKGLPSRRVT